VVQPRFGWDDDATKIFLVFFFGGGSLCFGSLLRLFCCVVVLVFLSLVFQAFVCLSPVSCWWFRLGGLPASLFAPPLYGFLLLLPLLWKRGTSGLGLSEFSKFPGVLTA
jgi:hypothetical protein